WSGGGECQIVQLRLLAAAALALALVVALLAWLGHRGGEPAGPPADPPGTFRPTAQQLKTLSIEPAATREIASVEVADGRIAVDPDRATPVYSPFTGRIVALRAAPGDVVARGANLATVEAAEFAQARGDLSTALAQERLTGTALERKRALYDSQGASLADVQQAEADRAAALAALGAARNRLAILGLSRAEVEALEHDAGGDARAALRAPIGGVVVDRQAGPGQYVQAGSGAPLFTIADTARVWVVGNVRESDAPAVRRGQAVEVRVPAWPGRVFAARLASVAATVDPATHRVAVRAELDNADGALKPEMLATLRIVTRSAAAAVAVPDGAVVYEGEQAHVWVVGDDGRIGLREVRTGSRADGYVEVREGLRAGERVVTRGSLFIDRAARHD
ncbi:MAG: efflux RND transporter periplasmic adaptor subunit, partial [Proteobacteria bacterium]|nr:efflux RND transporter periplasmic adaptor subunit [Pseudomonadota bacterium]